MVWTRSAGKPADVLAFFAMSALPDSRYQQAIQTFRSLLEEATAGGDPEPTAMTLATAAANGRVSARMVLLKGVDEQGFRFFTNEHSCKGEQLARNPQVALCFHWKTLRDVVQVRIEGTAQRLDDAASDAYFQTRARGSQIGAWASLQSQTLPDGEAFEQRYREFEQRFADGPVPRPPHWGGYLVVPDMFEFWYGGAFRIHERACYERAGDGSWSVRALYP